MVPICSLPMCVNLKDAGNLNKWSVNRFGVILDSSAGAMSKLVPLFSLGGGGVIGSGQQVCPAFKATWKRSFKLPWREAGPPHHHDDKVDSDQ